MNQVHKGLEGPPPHSQRGVTSIPDGILFLCQWSISQADEKQDHIARVESVHLQKLKLILGPYFDVEDGEKYLIA